MAIFFSLIFMCGAWFPIDVRYGNGFTVHFASPMDANTFRGKFIIEPEPERIQKSTVKSLLENFTGRS